VVDYLIFKGVDPAQLRAIGYGQEKPIADNQTDEGKFKNRRIEFEVLNTDSGVVREVDDRGVVVQICRVCITLNLSTKMRYPVSSVH